MNAHAVCVVHAVNHDGLKPEPARLRHRALVAAGSDVQQRREHSLRSVRHWDEVLVGDPNNEVLVEIVGAIESLKSALAQQSKAIGELQKPTAFPNLLTSLSTKYDTGTPVNQYILPHTSDWNSGAVSVTGLAGRFVTDPVTGLQSYETPEYAFLTKPPPGDPPASPPAPKKAPAKKRTN
jgi:hypothetical protein